MTESVMEGHGSYNSHSHPQEDAAAHGIRRLGEAARTMPLPAAGAATIADYGSSEGRNSLAPMSAAISAARDAHGGELAIQVVHTDLPANDHRQDHLRATLARGADGTLTATPFPVQDSAMITRFAWADGLIVRPPHAPASPAGSEVPVLPLDGD